MEAAFVSDYNREIPAARPGEFAPVRIGPIELPVPVVLAPMAGITNYPFRTICRRYGAGLYVSEMITARPLVDGNAKTLKLAEFGPDEGPRSLQLYGVDPHYVGRAVERLVGEGSVDHIDMNFGCPVRKVTRKGGGAAIPAKPKLLAAIVRAAVAHAGDVPVTIKFRVGIDDAVTTYLDAGRIGQEEGCAAVALHARTAAQLYDGEAAWETIARLKQAVTQIPVFGNGDIWEAADALRMMRETGCDGVVVGRGCLGRPWLFRDLADVFAGKAVQAPPNLGEVVEIMREHAKLLVDWFGDRRGILSFRRHAGWYTKGFHGGAHIRQGLVRVNSLADFDQAFGEFEPATPFPLEAMRMRRGKRSGTQRVALPEGYLENRFEDATPPVPEAESADSGG